MDLLERLSLTNPLKNRQRRTQRLIAGSASILIVVAACSLRKADAYVLEGASWPAGSTITFQMALGNAGRTLSDGNTSWDAAAAPAAGVWDQQMQRLVFRTVTNPSAPVSQGDGVNTVAFASTYFGSSFGSGTLAITGYYYRSGTMTEADILFNNRQSWDSYRGSLRSAADIRRVLIHEMGHALGLKHPDQAGQRVSAIMNSIISNLDTVTADDISGAQALYGAPQGTPTPTPTATPTPAPTPTATPFPTPTPTPATIPTLSLSASPTSINEGGSAVFTVTASSGSTVPRTVSYSMTGKAIYSRHYTLGGIFGQVTIPAGASSASVTLNSVAGSLRKGKKTATMILNSGAGYQLSFSSTASVTILNVNGTPASLTTASPSPSELFNSNGDARRHTATRSLR